MSAKSTAKKKVSNGKSTHRSRSPQAEEVAEDTQEGGPIDAFERPIAAKLTEVQCKQCAWVTFYQIITMGGSPARRIPIPFEVLGEKEYRLETWDQCTMDDLSVFFGGGPCVVICFRSNGQMLTNLALDIPGEARDVPSMEGLVPAMNEHKEAGVLGVGNVATSWGTFPMIENLGTESRTMWILCNMQVRRTEAMCEAMMRRVEAMCEKSNVQTRDFSRAVVAMAESRVAEAQIYAERSNTNAQNYTALQMELMKNAFQTLISHNPATGDASVMAQLAAERKRTEAATAQMFKMQLEMMLKKSKKKGDGDYVKFAEFVFNTAFPQMGKLFDKFTGTFEGMGAQDGQDEADDEPADPPPTTGHDAGQEVNLGAQNK